MTVIISADFEDQTIGNHPTNPPVYPQYADTETYQWPHIRGTETDTSPNGTRFLEYYISNAQDQAGSAIHNDGGWYMFTNGTTYYFAWSQKFVRIGGLDIWHDVEPDRQDSADKGMEISGTAEGIRWLISQGSWTGTRNQDHRWTIWTGNPSFHLDDQGNALGCPELEYSGSDAYPQNVSPYSVTDPIQLEYDRWYNFVMLFKLETWEGGTRDINGRVAAWVNGTKVIDYTNICTSNESTPGVEFIEINGTIAQPAYDAPPHYRRFDNFIFADAIADVDGTGDSYNYFSDPEEGNPQRPPSAPNNIRISTLSLRRLHPKF